MQRHRTDELHVVVPQLEGPPSRLAHHSEGLVEELVEGCAGLQPLPQLAGLRCKPLVLQLLEPVLQRVDTLHAIRVRTHSPRVFLRVEERCCGD